MTSKPSESARRGSPACSRPRDGCCSDLNSRALVKVSGPDWRSFLQGLLSHDVEALGVGEARFAGLLTPQGRLLFRSEQPRPGQGLGTRLAELPARPAEP